MKEVILDQHYTNEELSKNLIEQASIEFSEYDLVVEPSAGRGSFSDLIPENKRLAFDLDPKKDYIKKQDFLSLSSLGKENGLRILFVGNPPFGYRAQGAVSFFNHCALLGADTIAFVLPRSFRKAFVFNQLDRSFFLRKDLTIDNEMSFFHTGTSARCCFQVWSKNSTDGCCCYETRPKKILPKSCADLRIVSSSSVLLMMMTNNKKKKQRRDSIHPIEVAIRRTAFSSSNSKLGEVIDSSREINEIAKSNKRTQFIFFEARNKDCVENLKLLKEDINDFCMNTTVTSPTISGGEIIDLYSKKFLSQHISKNSNKNPDSLESFL